MKLSTRLFAAGTLAALLIGISQDGFAHEKMAKTTMSCCAKKADGMSCKECQKEAAASKTAKAKMGKMTMGKTALRTTSNAKMSPKVTGKSVGTKTSAQSAPKPAACCQQTDHSAQPA